VRCLWPILRTTRTAKDLGQHTPIAISQTIISFGVELRAFEQLTNEGAMTPSLTVIRRTRMSPPRLWYYHKDGRGFGPADDAEISGLIARDEIAVDTLVWRDGLSNWTEAQSTELHRLFFDVAPSTPIQFRTPSRQKISKPSWLFFAFAEIFNFLIVGIPLFVLLAQG
jgi:GYF domain 2